MIISCMNSYECIFEFGDAGVLNEDVQCNILNCCITYNCNITKISLYCCLF